MHRGEGGIHCKLSHNKGTLVPKPKGHLGNSMLQAEEKSSGKLGRAHVHTIREIVRKTGEGTCAYDTMRLSQTTEEVPGHARENGAPLIHQAVVEVAVL